MTCPALCECAPCLSSEGTHIDTRRGDSSAWCWFNRASSCATLNTTSYLPMCCNGAYMFYWFNNSHVRHIPYAHHILDFGKI